MFCTNCGARLEDGDRFCTSCGAPVPESEPEVTPEPAPTPGPESSAEPEPEVAPEPAPTPEPVSEPAAESLPRTGAPVPPDEVIAASGPAPSVSEKPRTHGKPASKTVLIAAVACGLVVGAAIAVGSHFMRPSFDAMPAPESSASHKAKRDAGKGSKKDGAVPSDPDATTLSKVSMTSSDGGKMSAELTYDDKGRWTGMKVKEEDGSVLTVTSSYDDASRLTSRIVERDGSQLGSVALSYDKDGRISSYSRVEDGQEVLSDTVTRDGQSFAIRDFEHGSVLNIQGTLDDQGRLLTSSTKGEAYHDGAPKPRNFERTYSYPSATTRTLRKTYPGHDYLPHDETFTVNDKGDVVLDDARWADGEVRGDSYEYEYNGDTCVKSVKTDLANRVERNGLTTCTGEYDDKGNQTRYTYSGPGHAAEIRRAFDESGRLLAVTTTIDNEKTTENYTYDKSGRVASVEVGKDGVTRTYTYEYVKTPKAKVVAPQAAPEVEVKLGTKDPYVTELTLRDTLGKIDTDDPLEFLPTVDVPDKD